MKALSLWQPWASLWLSPSKVHETRSWALKYPPEGFWLAVHAAKRAHSHDGLDLDDICNEQFGPHWFKDLPRGAIIGRVFVTDLYSTTAMRLSGDVPQGDDFDCGNYEDGRWAWRRSEFRRLRTPIPYRGLQGIFNVPEWPVELELAA